MNQPLAVRKSAHYLMDAQVGEAIVTQTTEELWRLMHDGLRVFIAKRVSDQEHVEDILQDVLLRTHRQVDMVNDSRRIVSWLYQVTRNAIIDHYRKPGRQREVPAGLSAELDVLSAAPTISELTRHGDAAELRTELAGCLRPMIERLPQGYRDAIMLVEIEGLTQQAAAKQMGISLSGMKSRVQQRLKRMLDQCCVIQLDRRRGIVEYKVREHGCNTCTSGVSKACP